MLPRHNRGLALAYLSSEEHNTAVRNPSGTKTRSRAYPALSLCEAVDVLRQLMGVFGFRDGDRDSIARKLGHSSGLSGVAGRKVAALVHFGLLERRESRYRVTALAQHICDSIS